MGLPKKNKPFQKFFRFLNNSNHGKKIALINFALPMKKIIAIGLTVLYLCFTAGALVRTDPDMFSYETLMDGRGNEKNESETNKGVEVFHIHQAAKSWSRLKAQYFTQNTTTDKSVPEEISGANGQLASYNNSVSIDHPIFLKNRVFRL